MSGRKYIMSMTLDDLYTEMAAMEAVPDWSDLDQARWLLLCNRKGELESALDREEAHKAYLTAVTNTERGLFDPAHCSIHGPASV